MSQQSDNLDASFALLTEAVVGLEDNARSSEGQPLSARRALNGTAYRIYRLLQWLIQSPLTVDQLNRKFEQDPGIGKSVSNDSIWLYINTLKALGCVIRRPTPRNGFAYQMVSHPFGMSLEQNGLEVLAQAKVVAQRHFSPQEMLALDSLLKKMIVQSLLKGSEDGSEWTTQLFVQSRSLDSQECRTRIEQLERAILEESLLEVTYASPLKGESVFTFLPESLFYRQGVVYVRGERLDYPGPSSLRVDRLLGVQTVQDDDLRAQLIDRQQIKMEIVLKVFVKSPQGFQGFALDPNQGVYQESRLWVDGVEPHYEVRLQVRDFFYVKQTLLSLGLPFAIESPEVFRQDVRETLRTMLEFYKVKGSAADGHG
jgi:predicted DNA-binding transcriptional regulator YafY